MLKRASGLGKPTYVMHYVREIKTDNSKLWIMVLGKSRGKSDPRLKTDY